jgi:putative SOS response-associated peptidase YedK
MCRSYVARANAVELARLFGTKPDKLPNLGVRYNLCPTDVAPLVRETGDGRRLETAVWDYRDDKVVDLKGRRPLINVQSERFRNSSAFASRRCLVPVDGFYEFEKTDGKPQPWLFRREDNDTFAFGGAWSLWQGQDETLLTFTLLTTAPGPLVAPVHDRMALVLDPADWDCWLTGDVRAAGALLRPNPMEGFVRHPVSRRVNSVRNDDISLLDPVEVEPQPGPAQPSLL